MTDYDENSYEENPAEYLKNEVDNLKARASADDATKLGDRIQQSEEEFIKDNPEYYNALNTIREKETDKLKIAGFSDEAAAQKIAETELATVQEIIKQGGDPAKYAYELAKQQYGFEPKEEQAATKRSSYFDQQATPEFDSAISEMFGGE